MRNNILEKLSNRVGFDVKKIARNSLHYYSANAIIAIVKFVLSLILVRSLSKDIYGAYGYVFSVIGVFAITSLPGLETAMKREVSLGNDYSFITSTKKRFLYGFIGVILTLLTAVFFFLKGNELLGYSFIISSIFLLPYFILLDYQQYFIGKEDFIRASWWYCYNIIISTLIVILALFISKDLKWLVFITMASSSVINLIFFLIVKNKIKIINRDTSFVRYGKHLTIIEFMDALAFYSDRLILPYFTSFTALASYIVASIIPSYIKLGVKIFLDILFHRFSTAEKTTLFNKFKKNISFIVLISMIIALVGIFSTPYVLPLLYSERYVDAIFPAQILIGGMFFFIPGLLVELVFQAQKRQKDLYKIRLFMLISRIISLIILVPVYGVVGAAISITISRIFYTGYGLKVMYS